MHPLRILLVASLAAAAGVAGAFGFLLFHAGISAFESSVLGVLVFVLFLVPWAAVFAWAIRRASDIDTLVDRSTRLAAGNDVVIHDRRFHGELDDLARGLEEVRVAIEREKSWSAEQRATLQQIVASLGEGILALSPKRKIVLANERVREMFGVAGDLVGRPLLDVIRNQSLVDAFEGALQGSATTGRIAFGERQIEIRVFPVLTSTEVAAVALFIDVSQIERLQRVRREFLDDFSHEVRTPLAGVRSAIETFERGGLSKGDEEQLRAVIGRQLRRIERLVQDLSELNRIESGELVLERQPADLVQLLVELCDEFRSRHGTQKIRLAADAGVPAIVDAPRAQQIFSNLLDNAFKHGGGRGEVLVEVERLAGEAVVRISDEGEGMPEHELERIFHRFYRVDKSRSQRVAGAGLGLAITRHLVLLHGGSIRAFNRLPRGATFEVRLPAAAGT